MELQGQGWQKVMQERKAGKKLVVFLPYKASMWEIGRASCRERV